MIAKVCPGFAISLAGILDLVEVVWKCSRLV